MIVSIDLLPRYLKAFGVLAGIMQFLKIEILKTRKVKLREVKFPFELRPNTTDLSVFREVFLFRSYDIEWEFPKVIVDGGANIGLTSIYLANKFPQSKIISVEPSSSNFELLSRNIKPYLNIIGLQSAIWNKDTTLKIRNLNENHWAFSVEECPADHPGCFNAITLSTLIHKYNLDSIDILKLDIEGSERELFLCNYENWINRTKCIVLELHDWLKPDCSKAVFKTISLYNFKTSIFNGMLKFVNSDK